MNAEKINEGLDLSLFGGQGAEAIILAGGLGTRLRDAVPDLPKCMAPVAGRPFLSFVIDALRMQGIKKFVFALGYKADVILQYLEAAYPTLSYSSVIENEPLGTGGAVQLALKKIEVKNALVANGDTLFKINLASLSKLYHDNSAECTLALKPMKDFDRYGVVEINKASQIISFKEKQFYKEGFINGGVYLLNKEKFTARLLPQKFSFEKDYLEKYSHENKFFGSVQNGYFIDIGIPEDYQQAQVDFKKSQLDLQAIDKSWTIFLDRDGVINEERIGKYVLNWNEFVFSSGVLEAFKLIGKKFGRIIIVSNQRGVGKLLMTENDLLHIHTEMKKEMEATGAKIDNIYYCTEKNDTCFNRKPNPGMAVQALNDFPDIDLSKTIMVGNKPGDMRFGRAAGMFTVFVTTTNPEQVYPHPEIDLLYPDLLSFAKAL
ncbi:MAG TPA: HAD-IIIA family hydrolase [Chitinophagaceae bacterium]|nr:HAD-IIIA family hydrolase [Chitinophagaceae bacterium]